MSIVNSSFFKEFVDAANDGWLLGWHESNGGNLSYRLTLEEVNLVLKEMQVTEWNQLGVYVPDLRNEFFLLTGSGKFFRNIKKDPENNICIIEIDETGSLYRIVWGLKNGGSPTSELPTHLMNHQIKKNISGGNHRVIYHAHPTNLIALTFLLPLNDETFTNELWQMATECPVVFPEGVGVIPWMVPGGIDIAKVTAEKMKTCNVAIWAHHGCFVSEGNFDNAFGLMHTVEKSAEILLKVLSVSPNKLQTIEYEQIRKLEQPFNVKLRSF